MVGSMIFLWQLILLFSYYKVQLSYVHFLRFPTNHNNKYCTKVHCIPENDRREMNVDEISNKFFSPYRYVARVGYDGSAFSGWQYQTNTSRTVQGVISKALSSRFQTTIYPVGAGRTDSGVHSRGQVIHFDTPTVVEDLKTFEYCINRMLPKDVQLYNTSIAPGGLERSTSLNVTRFHATSFALSKLYIYRFCTNSFVDPLRKRYYGHAFIPMNITLFQECLQLFVGTHDFRSFGNSIDHTNKTFYGTATKPIFTTIRTILNITLSEDNLNDEKDNIHGSGYYKVEFHLISALQHMVRNIIGSCMLVASGGSTLEHLKYLLYHAPGRLENKAKPAPPEGLTLEYVYYNDY